MPGEITNQPDILALPSPEAPLWETSKAAELNGDGEVIEKLQIVTSHLKK
jgi:hypothetical protein